ncbi:hypothetical protein [Anabaena azotica]
MNREGAKNAKEEEEEESFIFHLFTGYSFAELKDEMIFAQR